MASTATVSLATIGVVTRIAPDDTLVSSNGTDIGTETDPSIVIVEPGAAITEAGLEPWWFLRVQDGHAALFHSSEQSSGVGARLVLVGVDMCVFAPLKAGTELV